MTSNVIETFLQNGGAQVQALDGTRTPAIVIGAAQKIESLEHLLDAPVKIAERRKLDDLRGFVQYVNTYKTGSTAAFASRERIQVVFDYHAKDAPRWGAQGNRCSPEASPERRGDIEGYAGRDQEARSAIWQIYLS